MSTKFKESDLFPAFRIFGNLYFVGTVPASAHLVDTGEGLILLDAGYPHSFEQICESIRSLGFDPKDIRQILLTHGHIDHFGAAKELKELSGAEIAIGAEDEKAATGELPLSYAEEFHTTFLGTFRPDRLLRDGDELRLGNTAVRAVATPGHTQGAMSYFFDVSDGSQTLRAALHGGAGMNTLSESYLSRHGLPMSLREDLVKSMERLNEERVELFLGNHFGQCRTKEKYERLCAGDRLAFVDPEGWRAFNRSCLRSLEKLIEKEREETAQ